MTVTYMYDLLFESQREHKPVTVNIVDLLDTLDGSVDCSGTSTNGDWIMEMFVDKISDISDISSMIWLLPSILHNGLQCPLNVVYDYGKFKMGNGHHRLVLALLCGIDEIQVIVSENRCDFKSSEIEDLEQDSFIYDDSDADIFNEILEDVAMAIPESEEH